MNELTILILLASSSIILIILWIISFQQLCVTSKYDRERGIRTCYHTLFCFCGITLNGLIYLSLLFQYYHFFSKVNLSQITTVFEAFVMIFGFHLFRIFQLAIIDQLYLSLNMYPAQWIKKSFIILQIVFIIIVLLCYTLQFVFE
eukprot:UN07218